VPYLQQAFAAKAIGILVRDVIFLIFVERDAAALAFADVAHFTFERGLAPGTMFGFVLRHG